MAFSDSTATAEVLKPSGVRPRRKAHIIKPSVYSKTTLLDDIATLCDPRRPVADETVMNVLVKYFFAYIFPGAESHTVPLGDISDLFAQFYAIWRADDEEKKEMPEAFKDYGYALRMLADLPKSAHILRSIAARPLVKPDLSKPYRSLDLGTGTGVLLLATAIQSARNGFAQREMWGVELDEAIADRTRLVSEALDLGEIIVADARNPSLYARFGSMPFTFVSNETVPPSFQRLRSEHFTVIHAALFEACSKQLKEALFFPEALVVYEPKSSMSIALTKNNRFQTPKYYRHLHLFPQAIVIEGRLRLLHRLGRDFVKYVPRPFLEIMPGRW